jgi:adenylyltransferase/sulfurtransferase
MSTILSSPTVAPFSQHQAEVTKTKLPGWFPTFALSTFPDRPIYTVCRLGNDSQVAVKKLKELGADGGGKRVVGDIKGGFRAWREEVDPEWPDY